MLKKTLGVVVRTVKYGETSLICDIYTRELGLQTYIISGVRKPNSKISSSLIQVMSILDLVVYHRENKTMNRTKEVKPFLVYRSIPFDIAKGSVGLFMAELVQKTIKEAHPNPELYDFIQDSFIFLDQTDRSVANFHLFFMIQLAIHIGFMPGGDYSEASAFFDLREGFFQKEEPLHTDFLPPTYSKILYEIMETAPSTSYQLPITRAERQHLLDKFILFYQYHVDGFKTLNSYEIFKSIF